METVEVKIKPDGTIEVKVSGVAGAACERITQPLETVLGGEIVDRVYTEDYYRQEEEQAQAEQVLKTRY